MAVLKYIRKSGKYLGTRKVIKYYTVDNKRIKYIITIRKYEKLKPGWIICIDGILYKVLLVNSMGARLFPLSIILKSRCKTRKQEIKRFKYSSYCFTISSSAEVDIYGRHIYSLDKKIVK